MSNWTAKADAETQDRVALLAPFCSGGTYTLSANLLRSMLQATFIDGALAAVATCNAHGHGTAIDAERTEQEVAQ